MRVTRDLGSLLAAVLLAGAPGPVASAQAAIAGPGADPLFADHSVLSLTLAAPLRQILFDKSADPEYSPGKLSYVDDGGAAHEFDIRVRPRGKSRRDRQVCRFPPLRVNFKKSQVADTVFAKQNALKLVTHCQPSESFQRFLLKEYLVYRIFNLLSDVSFRVRLVKVTYSDSGNNKKPFERYGFFIEHKKRLAHRLGTDAVQPVRISTGELEPVQASIGEVFQYLVSNTDYSFIAAPPGETCCHNAILLQGPESSYYPIPYDFDRTGLVNPPTALPDENLGQRSVRQRLFRGFCRPEPYLEDALVKVREQRHAIEQLFETQTDLSDKARSKALRYISAFYDIINDEAGVERRLKCRRQL